MTTSPSVAPQPDAAHVPLDLAAGFRGAIKPVRKSPLYHLGLLLTAAIMLLLPLLYIAIVCAMALGVVWYAVHGLTLFESGGGGGAKFKLFAYVAPIIVGTIGVGFMVKPLFAPRGTRPEPFTLSRSDEPVLFAYIEMLCRLMGAPVPRQIDVDVNVNAAAGFRRGYLSFLGSDLVLVIGLPLVSGLDLRQLTGVLAHEFGHFTQGAGMRATYIVGRINNWFARVVYERDSWDESLDDWAQESGVVYISLIVWLAKLFVGLSRLILRLLMYLGHGVSCFMRRQQEYDADRYEARIAGSDCFAQTMRRIAELSISSNAAYGEVRDRWRARQLPDNLAHLIMATERSMPADVRSNLHASLLKGRTGLFDTHPAAKDRIRSVERENAPGIFHLDAPATVLFKDFDGVCKRASYLYYRAVLGEEVFGATFVATSGVVEQQARQSASQRAYSRFFGDILSSLRPLTLELPPRQPPADPRPTLAALKAARQRMAQNRDRATAAAGSYKQADDTLVEMASAQAVLDAGLRLIATRFHLPDTSPETIETRRRAAKAAQSAAAAILDPFESDMRIRLNAAMALLGVPGAGKRIADIPAKRTRATVLIRVNQAVGAAMPLAITLQRTLAAVHAASKAMQTEKDQQKGMPTVRRLAAEAEQTLRNIQAALGAAPYPFEHAERIPLANYVVNGLPPADNPGRVFAAAGESLERLVPVYFRTAAELAAIAEEVEAAVGLRPTDPAPATGS